MPRSDPLPAPRPNPVRSARTAQRRLQILEVASQCFAKEGFSRTRIDDVAAAAGISRALVHHYFGSKEALAHAVQDHMFEDWTAAVDRALAESDGVLDALTRWLRVNLADTRRRPLLLAILAEDAASVLVGWQEAARRAMAEWRSKLIALLAQGVGTGELRADLDPESAAEVLRAMQIGMMEHLLRSEPGVDVSDERHLRAATEMLVRGLRAEPRSG
jgi:AcrR family transcriptional regulator